MCPLWKGTVSETTRLSALEKHQGQIQYHAGIFCVVFLNVFKKVILGVAGAHLSYN